MIAEPRWLLKQAVLSIHDKQLVEHGGLSGIRDEGLLDSALSRPQNTYAYGGGDLFDLAASYAFGIARNHPFLDGNKRTAFVACETFLNLNSLELFADDFSATTTMLALAAGDMTEEAFADWLRQNSRPR